MDFVLISYTPYLLLWIIILAIIIYKSNYDFDYWKRKGVAFIKPLPLVGNCFEVFALRMTMGHLIENFYRSSIEPCFGMYIFNTPYLVLRDPDLIKSILVKHFDHFNDRNMLADEKLDSVASKTLFVLKNPEWKLLHTKFSPLFTATKLKGMSELMDASAKELNRYIANKCSEGFIETKELCGKYTTDVITSCAFGINSKCFENEDSEFRRISRKIFEFSWTTAIIQTSYFLAHWIVKLFRLPFLPPTSSTFLRNVFWETIRERKKTNFKRHDLIDIIMDINDGGNIIDEHAFDADTVLAQSVQYFIGGSETTSTAMSFTLYELCLHQEIQDKLRFEINAVISRNKVLNYQSVQDMNYLHMIIQEGLRKYPSPPFLDRICVENFKLPNSGVVIEKGTPVLVPLLGLHFDPQYFNDPEIFDPERFSDENKNKIANFTYLPFGDGPRGCVGARFGMLSMKIGIANIILRYRLERCNMTPVPVEFETKSFLLGSKCGLPIKFTPIKSCNGIL